jgi:hypothetical protein
MTFFSESSLKTDMPEQSSSTGTNKRKYNKPKSEQYKPNDKNEPRRYNMPKFSFRTGKSEQSSSNDMNEWKFTVPNFSKSEQSSSNDMNEWKFTVANFSKSEKSSSNDANK